jgi:hypothetical protein
VEQFESFRSPRNSLIELGADPIVSMAENLLDAAWDEQLQMLPSHASVSQLTPRPSTLLSAAEDVRFIFP